jgi:hypothetical protein
LYQCLSYPKSLQVLTDSDDFGPFGDADAVDAIVNDVDDFQHCVDVERKVGRVGSESLEIFVVEVSDFLRVDNFIKLFTITIDNRSL